MENKTEIERFEKQFSDYEKEIGESYFKKRLKEILPTIESRGTFETKNLNGWIDGFNACLDEIKKRAGVVH